MAKIGIAALAINSDTVAAARMRNEDIWTRACTGISMVILGPEQLIPKGFRAVLAFEPFYEIAWVLTNNDQKIIFCLTISLVFRVKAYLNSLLSADSTRDFRIHMHTGLNWPDDKLQTLADIVNEPGCQIIIATNGLVQGNDIRVIETVIQLGEPESVEIPSGSHRSSISGKSVDIGWADRGISGSHFGPAHSQSETFGNRY
ncbi:hypothetical protein B0H13DRAFT_1896016 [Mycena leptocephala]|nr:hypothetical protein B0H13DRAFT_1896016 [Mycena leptocephala]